MDRITKFLVKDFLENNEKKSTDESEDFENFCNYCIVYKEYKSTFSFEDVSTGNSAQGIDGIAIIVNGRLVTTKEEVSDLINLNKYIEAHFIFIQCKTSPTFEGSEIGNFIHAVKDFLSESPQLVMNETVNNFHEISNYIFENSPKMIKGKPKCNLYYVTTGIWQNDTNVVAVINSGTNEIKRLNLFEKVDFDPVDASSIQKYYAATKETTSVSINFKDKITLPDIEKVRESFLGYLPFFEFKKIIIDDNGSIRNIFYDNIRDFLGENSVNDSISKTIKNKQFDVFSILNNGVTIVADDLKTSGNRFTIIDYQIVNGCQTSHVLYQYRDIIGIDNVNIPIRLIVTNDEDVKNQITIATNSQTEVKPEQLAALSEFQKELESYYNTYEGEQKLFYERRTNQYSREPSIPKTRIITIPMQIKTFSSMFLTLPHLVSGYYGTIAKNLGEQIFNKSHKHILYYTSSYTMYKLESLFRSGLIDGKYKKFKFQMILLYRIISAGKDIPEFNSKKIEKYCDVIIKSLVNNEECIEIFNKINLIIDKSDLAAENKRQFKEKESTDILIKILENK